MLDKTRAGVSVSLFAAALSVLVAVAPPALAEEPEAHSIGTVNTDAGFWYLRTIDGSTTSFYYGNPGDSPFTGDWDCDGVDTPGLYRQSDGYVYLRNSNTQGIADVAFYFGNPGDVPLPGDFNGDGCDTVSLYRPSEQRFFVINRLGSGDEGLGAADYSFLFGNPGDEPYVGDFDGDGVDDVAVFRASNGTLYQTLSPSEGATDAEVGVGGGATPVLGSWDGAAADTMARYLPSSSKFDVPGIPGEAETGWLTYGRAGFAPISGFFGALPGGDEPPNPPVVLVSTYTTTMIEGEARNTNIKRIADQTDGAVLQQGETFSLNDRTGPRTIENGYVPAPAIIGGEIYCCDHPVNIGGGTSQFSTTLFNAMFFGAYEDVYHKPHSLYIATYPQGREATINYDTIDLNFRNDTPTPMTIRTSHTETSVTVNIYGNNEGRSVETWNVGTATPEDGGTVTVYREITYSDGSSIVQSWTWRYRRPAV